MDTDIVVELLDSLHFATEPGSAEAVTGVTTSREQAVGRRYTWPIRVGATEMALWETVWSTAERELVLARQEVAGPIPTAVANLMARRRALVETRDDFEFISARRVDPDADDWPRFSNCGDNDLRRLIPPPAERKLRELGYVGYATRSAAFGSVGRQRGHLIGLFTPGSRAAQVGFYVLTRLVPTFRHTRLLEGTHLG